MNSQGHQDAVAAPAQSKLGFIGYAATSCVANATWWMQPLLIEHWVSAQGMNESAAGFVVSAEMACMAITGSVLPRVLTSGRLMTWALVGMVLAILASAASLQATSLVMLVLLRSLVGVGTGLVMMISFMAISRTELPDKVFANVNMVNLLFGVVLVGTLPALRSLSPVITPLHAVLLSLIVMFLPVAAIPRGMKFMPAPSAATTDSGAQAASTSNASTPLLIGVAIGIGLCSGVAFAMCALVGIQMGLKPADVDAAIAFGIAVAIPTTIIAALIGTRFGRVPPMTFALMAVAANMVLLGTHPTLLEFRIAAALNVAGLYFALPFLFGAAAALDSQGKGAAFVGSSFFLAGAFSPFVGGMVIEFLSIQVLVPIVCVVLLLALIGFATVQKQLVRSAAAA